MWDLTMKAVDTVNGQLGTCYATIDGNLEEMIYVKSIEAKADKTKKEIKVLGYTGSKNKSAGWKGTGNCTMYYVSPLYRRLMLEYMHTGKDFYMDMYIENEDPGSATGKQKIWLKNVNFDGITLSKLDVDNTELDEEVSFTFDDAEMITELNEITGE